MTAYEEFVEEQVRRPGGAIFGIYPPHPPAAPSSRLARGPGPLTGPQFPAGRSRSAPSAGRPARRPSPCRRHRAAAYSGSSICPAIERSGACLRRAPRGEAVGGPRSRRSEVVLVDRRGRAAAGRRGRSWTAAGSGLQAAMRQAGLRHPWPPLLQLLELTVDPEVRRAQSSARPRRVIMSRRAAAAPAAAPAGSVMDCRWRPCSWNCSWPATGSIRLPARPALQPPARR